MNLLKQSHLTAPFKFSATILEIKTPLLPSQVLVGNKCDLEGNVSYSDIKQLAYYNNLLFVETSAKDSTNVEEVFQHMCKELVEKREQLLSMGSLDNTGPQSIFFHEHSEVNTQPAEGYCCTYI